MKIKINPELEHVTDRSDLLRDFVIFVCKDLHCMPCDIDIVNGRDGAGLKTTAQYDPNNHRVMVNAKNRHFGDVLRSIAHELVHHKQNVKGELSGPVQDVGGDIEDEANARAGALLKSFAYQEGPERIYEGADLLKAYVGRLIEQGSTPLPPGVATAKKAKEKIDKSAKAMRDYLRRMSKSAYDQYVGSGIIPVAIVDKFSNPVPGSVTTSIFNDPNRDEHFGIDLAYKQGKEGDDVMAAAPGSVHFAGKKSGYGNVVIVNHLMEGPEGAAVPYKTVYAHLRDIYAARGDQVVPGTVIGTLGNTGDSDGPHVHFEIQQGSAVKDPASPAGIRSIRLQMISRKLKPQDPNTYISFGKSALQADEETCAIVHDRLGGKNRDKSKGAPRGCGATFKKLD
jgi:murein DD-endopeptidase MepM/ murein hydrolase activator NlpD